MRRRCCLWSRPRPRAAQFHEPVFLGTTRSTIHAHGMWIGAGGAHHLVKTDNTDDARNIPIPPDAPAPREKIEKTSYEASEQVQRWLREQAAERIGAKPPFTPTFLAHQRDRLR